MYGSTEVDTKRCGRQGTTNRRTAADCVDEEVVTDIADVAASTLQDEMDVDDLTWLKEETV